MLLHHMRVWQRRQQRRLEARGRGRRAARDVKVDHVPLAPLCKHTRVHQAKCVVTHLVV